MKALSILAVSLVSAVSMADPALFSQAPNIGGEGGPFSFNEQLVADQFSLGASSTVQSVTWWGNNYFSNDPYDPGADLSFHLEIYADEAGVPGASLYSTALTGHITSEDGVNDYGATIYRFDGTLSSPALSAGTTYWLSIVEAGVGSTGYRWQTSAGGDYSAYSIDGGNSWMQSTVTRQNLAFELRGEAVPEPASMAALGLAGLALVRRRRKA